METVIILGAGASGMVAALILIVGGVNLLLLGLVGEYVGRVFMCVNATPQYVEREVIPAGKK